MINSKFREYKGLYKVNCSNGCRLNSGRFLAVFMLICIVSNMFIPISLAKSNSEFKIYNDKKSSYKKNGSRGQYVVYKVKKDKTKGKYPTRPGVILVTSTGSVAKVVGHAGIVYSKSNIIESLSKGVCVGANNWYSSKNTVAAATVCGSTVAQDKKVANWCKSKVGKKYNYNYYSTSTRKKFYCSQLVWAGFKDCLGINLNTSKYDIFKLMAIGPFEFVRENTDKLFLVYMKNWNKNDVTK